MDVAAGNFRRLGHARTGSVRRWRGASHAVRDRRNFSSHVSSKNNRLRLVRRLRSTASTKPNQPGQRADVGRDQLSRSLACQDAAPQGSVRDVDRECTKMVALPAAIMDERHRCRSSRPRKVTSIAPASHCAALAFDAVVQFLPRARPAGPPRTVAGGPPPHARRVRRAIGAGRIPIPREAPVTSAICPSQGLSMGRLCPVRARRQEVCRRMRRA